MLMLRAYGVKWDVDVVIKCEWELGVPHLNIMFWLLPNETEESRTQEISRYTNLLHV
jgi:hypothetical protein